MFESDPGTSRQYSYPETTAGSIALRAELDQPPRFSTIGDAVWRAVFYLRRSIWFLSHIVSLAMVFSSVDEDAVGV
jgi:hypothetical protein